MEKRNSHKFTGVWCTQCVSNLLPRKYIIVRHFKTYHGGTPTEEEIKQVLANTFHEKFKRPNGSIPSEEEIKQVLANTTRKKFKRSKRRLKPMPSDKYQDPEVEHNRRWRNIIQAGAFGLGKKR